jgi:hypothetical protein
LPSDQNYLLNLRSEPSHETLNTQKRGRSVPEGIDDHYENVERTGFPPQAPAISGDSTSQLNEQLESTYYQMVHSIVPLLPNEQAELRRQLSALPDATRAALLAAMNATLSAAPYSGTLEDTTHSDHAVELLNVAQASDRPDYARIQTLIFLALGTNNRGTNMFRGGTVTGVSPGIYLTQAVTIGGEIGIFDPHIPREIDSNRGLAVPRCLAISLSILDTLNFFATRRLGMPKNPLLLPTVKNEVEVIGQRTYWLASKYTQTRRAVRC